MAGPGPLLIFQDRRNLQCLVIIHPRLWVGTTHGQNVYVGTNMLCPWHIRARPRQARIEQIIWGSMSMA